MEEERGHNFQEADQRAESFMVYTSKRKVAAGLMWHREHDSQFFH